MFLSIDMFLELKNNEAPSSQPVFAALQTDMRSNADGQVEALTRRNSSLASQLKLVSDERDALRATNEQQADLIAQLQRDLSDRDRERDALKAQVSSLQGATEQLNAQVAEITRQLQDSQTDLKTQTERVRPAAYLHDSNRDIAV